MMRVLRQQVRAGMPLLLLLLLTAAFFLPWCNRFAGLRSGAGELAGGLNILAGRVPYRDYFNPGPPLNAFKAAGLMRVFGRSLLVLRVAAVGERLLLATMLFVWLCRLVPRPAAWVASVVTVVVSAGDRTDPLCSYNHDAILLSMAAAMCLDSLLAGRSRLQGRLTGRAAALLVAAGVLAGLSALTKQTVGVGCATFFLAWLLLVSHRVRWPWQLRAWSCLCFTAGYALPLLLLALWLWHRGGLAACLRMTLVQGPSAKAGSPADFLHRTLLVGYDNAGWVVLGGFFFLLATGPLRRFGQHLSGRLQPSPVSTGLRFPVMLFASAMLVACFLSRTALPTLHDQGKSGVYFTLLVLLLLGWRLLTVPVAEEQRRIASLRLLLFVLTGLGTALTLSLSWPAFEAMLLPGLALPIALAFTYCRGWARYAVLTLLAFAIFLQFREKLDLPFGFDYQDEAPVHEAAFTSQQPLLRGMRLPASTLRLLDDSASLIQQCVRPGETVFTYPEMGLLYALSGTAPPTTSPSHNIDVVNDSFAQQEADQLLAQPPRVLLAYTITEEQERGAERLWRRGRPAGQRAIAAAVKRLELQYRLVGNYQLRQGDPVIGMYLSRTGKYQQGPCR